MSDPRTPAPDDRSAEPPIVLEARGLRKRFGEHEVLRGVDLAVADAEVVSIIGPNGSGKSTLLRCLNLLETYHAGEVLLDGQVASRGRPDDRPLTRDEQRAAQQLRQRVGMVFQHFNLFPHLTVLHNVMTGPLHALGRPRPEARDRALAALRKVGLAERAEAHPSTLSGGQQQRVAIARALAMDPDVLLFDEATSALDPRLTHEVLRVIRELLVDGMTMILVTHDMDFAREVSDRVVFMEAGRIEAQGTPEDLFERPATAALRQFLDPDAD